MPRKAAGTAQGSTSIIAALIGYFTGAPLAEVETALVHITEIVAVRRKQKQPTATVAVTAPAVVAELTTAAVAAPPAGTTATAPARRKPGRPARATTQEVKAAVPATVSASTPAPAAPATDLPPQDSMADAE